MDGQDAAAACVLPFSMLFFLKQKHKFLQVFESLCPQWRAVAVVAAAADCSLWSTLQEELKMMQNLNPAELVALEKEVGGWWPRWLLLKPGRRPWRCR